MDLKNDKEKLQQLANLMNEQSATPILMVTDDLLYVFDAALDPDEVDFLLKMGGGNQKRSEVEARTGLPKGEFNRLLTTLLDKGHITELEPEPGQDEPILHLMCIFPGWFEHYLMGGKDTPDRREFARRVTKYFAMARDVPPDVLNDILVGVGPQRSIATASPPTPRHIKIEKTLPPQVSEIYPPHSVLSILERLPEDEVISVGHCFCRQQRKLDGDPCRMSLPEEACLGLGPAAQHIIDRGFGRRISKPEAIKLVKESGEKGAIHQVGRLVPLKDFRAKYEVDIICNCCWDCCGVVGNYSRGNLPFMLKSYYIAEMPDSDKCNGCRACEDYCPVRAIAVDESGIARVNADMCCGCGVCVLHCAEQAIRLKPFERNVFLPVLVGEKRRIA
jgi:Pyruvate/2-oxoacid:ferredoxin oxidoreductase delta subunit